MGGVWHEIMLDTANHFLASLTAGLGAAVHRVLRNSPA